MRGVLGLLGEQREQGGERTRAGGLCWNESDGARAECVRNVCTLILLGLFFFCVFESGAKHSALLFTHTRQHAPLRAHMTCRRQHTQRDAKHTTLCSKTRARPDLDEIVEQSIGVGDIKGGKRQAHFAVLFGPGP